MPLPSDPSIFEYFFDARAMQWTHISTLSHNALPAVISTPRSGYHILMPTSKLLVCATAMQKAINGNSNVLLIGPWSAGKSALTQYVTSSGCIKAAGNYSYAPNVSAAFSEIEENQDHTHLIRLLLTKHMSASRYANLEL